MELKEKSLQIYNLKWRLLILSFILVVLLVIFYEKVIEINQDEEYDLITNRVRQYKEIGIDKNALLKSSLCNYDELNEYAKTGLFIINFNFYL